MRGYADTHNKDKSGDDFMKGHSKNTQVHSHLNTHVQKDMLMGGGDCSSCVSALSFLISNRYTLILDICQL